ncbi:Dirigent protein 23 [Linum grandiflorum]
MTTTPLFLIVVAITIACLSSIPPLILAQQPPTPSPDTAVSWATRLSSSGSDTVTNLQFYFHDILSGNNPTAVQVASPASGSSGSGFGSITMADDPLTETSDPNSKLVGRAQGIYASASQSGLALLMSMSYGFVLGRNEVMTQGRELPVLGGTGLFRMARGYAVLQTTSANSAGDAVVFYNVTVFAPASNAENEALPFTPVGGGAGGGRSRGGGGNGGGDSSPAGRVPASGWVGGAVVAAVACFLSM